MIKLKTRSLVLIWPSCILKNLAVKQETKQQKNELMADTQKNKTKKRANKASEASACWLRSSRRCSERRFASAIEAPKSRSLRCSRPRHCVDGMSASACAHASKLAACRRARQRKSRLEARGRAPVDRRRSPKRVQSRLRARAARSDMTKKGRAMAAAATVAAAGLRPEAN